ncbi:MAG: nitrile hydratase accessory protein [Methylobacteriaceae bacterium]|nr:nitrile hydratase accessory protein [Methylobacteriaceae bacterium]
MSTATDFSTLPFLPRDIDGPVFHAPWEAQAFALAVQLQERGLFTWEKWADARGAEIGAAQTAGDPDLGDTYYLHWLAALERLVVAKGVASEGSLQVTKDAWDRAAKATPHGQPIVLPP